MSSLKLQNTKSVFYLRLRRYLRLALIIGISLIAALVLGWYILTAYVNRHKQELLNNITEKISADISGKLAIKDMEPVLWRSFPGISVRLDSVSLVDSLYRMHHLKTVELQSVYVRMSVLSLFSGQPKIKKIILSNGTIQLFTLAKGYSNSYLLAHKRPQNKAEKNELPLRLLGAENVTFIVRHEPHHKLFKVSFNTLNASFKEKKSGLSVHFRMDAFVHQLGFNLRKGNYLEGKEVKAAMSALFDKKKKCLTIDKQRIFINQAPLDIHAKFDFAGSKPSFQLGLEAGLFDYNKGINLLPGFISKKLGIVSISKPISVSAEIRGLFQYPDTPEVLIRAKIKNADVLTPYGSFDHTGFTVRFSNYLKPGHGKGDDNSGLFISELKGNWMDLPVSADSISIVNLKQPLLYFNVKGDFETSKLNRLLGHSFAIANGTTALQLTYLGPVNAADTAKRNLNGYIVLTNTNLTYLPRALKFSNCNAALVFQGQDLLIKTMSLGVGKSTILVRGKGENFLNAYFSANEKAVFNCRLEAPELNLNELLPLLSPRKYYQSSASRQRTAKNAGINNKLDQLLDKSTMSLDMNIRKIEYKKFVAHNMTANLRLDAEGITLKNVHLEHAGGSVSFHAFIQQQTHKNNFYLGADLEGIKINELFYSFSNFGQNTLKAENLKGRLSANMSLAGSLSEQAKLIPGTLHGKVNFVLKDGELNDFPPFLGISKFAFKNRNLDHITFQTLSNNLTIEGGRIQIPSMDIASSAISITVQGVYAFDLGTDISLKIPLRNPQKDRERNLFARKPRKSKGVIVYLRAKDDANGKVHIGWDPKQKSRLKDTTGKALNATSGK